MTKAVTDFPWTTHLRNLDPSKQVDLFNNKILNIASNFIPNNYVKIQPDFQQPSKDDKEAK